MVRSYLVLFVAFLLLSSNLVSTSSRRSSHLISSSTSSSNNYSEENGDTIEMNSRKRRRITAYMTKLSGKSTVSEEKDLSEALILGKSNDSDPLNIPRQRTSSDLTTLDGQNTLSPESKASRHGAEEILYSSASFDSLNVDQLDSFDFEFNDEEDEVLSLETKFDKIGIYDQLFRADHEGETVIFNHNDSKVSIEDFEIDLFEKCLSSSIFATASNHPAANYLIGTELEIQVDESFKFNIPLHPLYVLVREIIVYFISKGRVDVLKEAIRSGINLKFELFLEEKNFKFDLLYLACRYVAGDATVEIIGLLVQEGRLDPNYLNSFGYAAIHIIASQGSYPMAEALLSLGADPNISSQRSDFMAPIHLAAKFKNYLFLKPFIYLNSVDVNLLDHSQNHLIQYSLIYTSFGFFSDLLLHPRIILSPKIIEKVLLLLHEKIPAEDERYYDVFVDFLLNRGLYMKEIAFHLIKNGHKSGLRAFRRKSFDFGDSVDSLELLI